MDAKHQYSKRQLLTFTCAKKTGNNAELKLSYSTQYLSVVTSLQRWEILAQLLPSAKRCRIWTGCKADETNAPWCSCCGSAWWLACVYVVMCSIAKCIETIYTHSKYRYGIVFPNVIR